MCELALLLNKWESYHVGRGGGVTIYGHYHMWTLLLYKGHVSLGKTICRRCHVWASPHTGVLILAMSQDETTLKGEHPPNFFAWMNQLIQNGRTMF